MKPRLPLYSDRDPRRLLPKACAIANGELAALFAVPLIKNPSAARWLSSDGFWFEKASLLGVVASGCAGVAGADAAGLAAFTSVRWKALCVLVGAAGAFFTLRGFPLAGSGAFASGPGVTAAG